MKTLLLMLISVAPCAAQSVYLVAGGGAGVFNNKWEFVAPAFSAGILIDDEIGERSGLLYGLHYRQRSESGVNTRLGVVQFDVAGRYSVWKIDVGVGGFYNLATGTTSDVEPPIKFGSGVGVCGFVAYRIWPRFSVRLAYDQGLTDISDLPGNTAAQGAYILFQHQLSKR